ncbi:MAG: heavy-metal-associated domain-containing protein [Paludibacteraceae bacterium]|nr:heavy-metal-associated domain-containing protein [Paludibacteraceae bacterium]
MKVKTYAVSGMKCENCKAKVENALKAIEGVSKAEASVEAGNVVVEMEDGKVTDEQIKDAVEGSGRFEIEVQ